MTRLIDWKFTYIVDVDKNDIWLVHCNISRVRVLLEDVLHFCVIVIPCVLGKM